VKRRLILSVVGCEMNDRGWQSAQCLVHACNSVCSFLFPDRF